MVSVLSVVVPRRNTNAVEAHATVRQAGHQPAEASQRTMLHALVRGRIAQARRGAVIPRYELGYEPLRRPLPAGRRHKRGA